MTDWSQEAIEHRIQARIGKPSPPQAVTVEMLEPRAVVVTDIHMSFVSMVSFMVKWAIASIPALLIVFILALMFWGFVLSIFSGVGGLNKH
jgi:hypothetical protein